MRQTRISWMAEKSLLIIWHPIMRKHVLVGTWNWIGMVTNYVFILSWNVRRNEMSWLSTRAWLYTALRKSEVFHWRKCQNNSCCKCDHTCLSWICSSWWNTASFPPRFALMMWKHSLPFRSSNVARFYWWGCAFVVIIWVALKKNWNSFIINEFITLTFRL